MENGGDLSEGREGKDIAVKSRMQKKKKGVEKLDNDVDFFLYFWLL